MDNSPLKQNRIVPLDKLNPHPRNYREHPETQVNKLVSSLVRFGQGRSIVVQDGPQGYLIVAGHGIVQAATKLGYTELRADILPADWTSEQVDGYLVADNMHSQEAQDDDRALAELLQEQQDAGFDLQSLGTDDEYLRQLLEGLGDEYLGNEGEDEEDDFDEEPDEEQTRVKLGDVWQLGEHRIGCLDALDPASYEKLLQSTRPHAIITDPPYGMKLDTDYSKRRAAPEFAAAKGVKSGRKYAEVIGDQEDFDATPLVKMFSDVKEQFWFGADYYSASLPDTMHEGCWIVWDKRVEENFDDMLGSCFELIWSKQKHKRDILRCRWVFIFGTEHEPQRGRQHPTQKPVLLIEDLINRYTSEGQIILDPFLGSGTTVISAERTGRIAYGCELSPAYIDVCITRWEQLTNQQATLLDRVEEATHA